MAGQAKRDQQSVLGNQVEVKRGNVRGLCQHAGCNGSAGYSSQCTEAIPLSSVFAMHVSLVRV